MENLSLMKRFKVIVACCSLALIVVIALSVVSFIQVGKVRRVNAEYEKKLEQVLEEQAALKKDIEYLESEEGKDETARDNGYLNENENEIIAK